MLLPWTVEVVCYCLVTKSSRGTLCDPMDCRMPGFPVLHYLPEFAHTHIHWVCDAIQPSHTLSFPFSSCLQSFAESGCFQMSQLFTSGGQSIGASTSVSALSKKIQGWFPLELTGLISLQSKGLSRVFSSSTTQKDQFFGTQPWAEVNTEKSAFLSALPQVCATVTFLWFDVFPIKKKVDLFLWCLCFIRFVEACFCLCISSRKKWILAHLSVRPKNCPLIPDKPFPLVLFKIFIHKSLEHLFAFPDFFFFLALVLKPF